MSSSHQEPFSLHSNSIETVLIEFAAVMGMLVLITTVMLTLTTRGGKRSSSPSSPADHDDEIGLYPLGSAVKRDLERARTINAPVTFRPPSVWIGAFRASNRATIPGSRESAHDLSKLTQVCPITTSKSHSRSNPHRHHPLNL